MKRVLIAVFVLGLFPASGMAQSDAPRGWGYGFGAIGGTSGDFGRTMAQFGAGGEGLFFKGLGAGAEVSYVTRTDGGNAFGLLSTNLTYHFVKPGSSQKLVPFVTGGPSLTFRGAAGGNFGGGVQYWMKDRLGLRLEFRNHVFSSDSPHLYGFRVGLAFR
jgi:hypothetical protein